jgi:type I restriction enzyme S subunit
MRPETFLEKFDLIADAPSAVEKMRELVLRLAVQGKLVDQDHAEISALDCIRAANKPLIEIILDESVQTPYGWAALPLGCVIASNTGGGTPSKQNPGYWNGLIPWASVKDIQSEKFLNETIDSITEAGLQNSSSNLIPPNRLIVVTRMGLGKLAINSIPVAINQDLRAIEPTRALDLDFAYLLFKSLKMVGSGVTVKGITVDKLHAMPILLPPLAEQKRIVAKVDELMALCDRLEQQQKDREAKHAALTRASLTRFSEAPTPENLNLLFHPSYTTTPAELRKTILTLAVQGKLVPQDPNDESAQKIITKVEILRPDAVDDSVNNNDGPWSLPSSWSWVRLGKIAMIKHGYAFSSASFTSVPTPYVLTTPGNFYESGGFRDRGDNTKYFKGEVPHSFVFDAGDLIIPMTEQAAGLLGSPAFIPDDGKTYLQNQRLGKLDFYSNEILPSYVFCFFNDEFFRSELARTCTGMKVRHTSPKRVLNVPFALPPIAEQKRIVAKVDELMKLVDQLEEQLTTARSTAENLLNALLADLTSQKAD